LQGNEEQLSPLQLVGMKEPLNQRGLGVVSGLLVFTLFPIEDHGLNPPGRQSYRDRKVRGKLLSQSSAKPTLVGLP
jgi:hypothetical protein